MLKFVFKQGTGSQARCVVLSWLWCNDLRRQKRSMVRFSHETSQVFADDYSARTSHTPCTLRAEIRESVYI